MAGFGLSHCFRSARALFPQCFFHSSYSDNKMTKTLLIKNARVVVTMDDERREIAGGGVFIRDNVIEQVGPTALVAQSYSEGPGSTDREAMIASRIMREIRDRLHFLNDVGVGYLTLRRSAASTLLS